jgi:hypothetical protein
VIYLIEYDRESGKLVRIEEFVPTQRRQAEEKRLRVEIERLETGVSREVVLLEASSQDELRKTHRRYFECLDEMLTQALATGA